MEWRDIGAIVTGGVALYGAVTGTIALSLAWMKDRREREASEPVVDVRFGPTPDMPNNINRGWSGTLTISNRGSTDFVLKVLRVIGLEGAILSREGEQRPATWPLNEMRFDDIRVGPDDTHEIALTLVTSLHTSPPHTVNFVLVTKQLGGRERESRKIITRTIGR